MRQAGRHLPEYLELRAKNKNFLDFCYAPSNASEATLQPLRRYDIDAAIIFSDILVIPHALGVDVKFEEGIGPILQPTKSESELTKLKSEKLLARLSPVYEAIERTKSALPNDKTLIGFAGAPWTLATYMIQGRGGNRELARAFAMQNPVFMEKLFDILIENTALHLSEQLKSGADCVQIFESWAEDLSEYAYKNYVEIPNAKLVKRLRELSPKALIIGFPRGASSRAARFYENCDFNAVGLDISADISKIRVEIGEKACLQGNLDPMCLIAGGEVLEKSVLEIMEKAANHPHIFNLGHGISPQTPISNVERMIEIIRKSQ